MSEDGRKLARFDAVSKAYSKPLRSVCPSCGCSLLEGPDAKHEDECDWLTAFYINWMKYGDEGVASAYADAAVKRKPRR